MCQFFGVCPPLSSNVNASTDTDIDTMNIELLLTPATNALIHPHGGTSRRSTY